MATTATPAAGTATVGASESPKAQFLRAFEMEHATTMKLLRAYPQDKLDLTPHPKCKSARELAWMFALESGLAERALKNELKFPPDGPMP